jgi:hypothetical protein
MKHCGGNAAKGTDTDLGVLTQSTALSLAQTSARRVEGEGSVVPGATRLLAIPSRQCRVLRGVGQA